MEIPNIGKGIFHSLPIFSFSRPKNVGDILVHAGTQNIPYTRDVWTMLQASYPAETVLHVPILKMLTCSLVFKKNYNMQL